MPPRLEAPTIVQSRSLLRWRASDARRGILARERHPPAEKAGLDAPDRFGSARRPDGVLWHVDRQSVVSGKSVSVRVDLGGRRIIKKTHEKISEVGDSLHETKKQNA